jgi:hypothetical protein
MSKKHAKLSMTPPSQVARRSASEGVAAAREARALEEGTARLTLDMPVAAHRALKILATERGVSMRDFIMEALREKGLRWE